MSIFDTTTFATSQETSIILNFMTESVEIEYDEIQGRTVLSLFEENSDDLGLVSSQRASFRNSQGEVVTPHSVIQPGWVLTASVSHDSKGNFGI